MKIAYLIQAHTHPELVARLINSLTTENSYFFIHIDKKVNISPFINCITPLDKIVFTKKRARVFWMGYSVVEATLILIKEAMKYSDKLNEPFKYYVLLSGADYPIKSNQYIFDFFEKASNTEYMLFWKLTDESKWLHKIEKYHYLDSRFTNAKSSLKYFRRFYEIAHKRVHKIIPKRKYLKQIIPYGGSGWWMLTHEAVHYILEYVNNNKKFRNFYRFTHSPDEMVFQTIILNSPLAAEVKNYSQYEELRKKHGTCDEETIISDHRSFYYRYIDWDLNREFPAILNENDFSALQKSECLFARKMDPHKSEKLLDLIDNNLRE